MPERLKTRAPRRRARAPLITLLTDFGLDDIYVGVMKGVIASRAPRVPVIDLSHGIRPQDVAQAGIRLRAAVPWFPPRTIHVAVVDPGVGGSRAVLALRARGAVFLAPDNGLLGLVVRPEEIEELVSVEEPRYILPRQSGTFHGRDIFAPVAARLALGLPLSRLGPRAAKMERLELPEARETPARGGTMIRGQIVDIDNFGNCITNIPVGPEAARVRDIRVGRRRFPAPERSYCAGRIGEPLVVVGSTGYLEVAVNRGRADLVLGLRRGQRVTAWRT